MKTESNKKISIILENNTDINIMKFILTNAILKVGDLKTYTEPNLVFSPLNSREVITMSKDEIEVFSRNILKEL